MNFSKRNLEKFENSGNSLLRSLRLKDKPFGVRDSRRLRPALLEVIRTSNHSKCRLSPKKANNL